MRRISRMQLTASLVVLMLVGGSCRAGVKPLGGGTKYDVARDWPAWRGVNGLGIRNEPLDVKPWTNTKGVRWKVPIPGQGHGSPIVVGERIFVSTAEDKGQARSLLCLNRETGNLLWKTVYHAGGFMFKNQKNTHASATPVCAGERVFIPYIADGGLWLSAVDVDGKQAWQKKLGPFVSEWGYASSPALYKDLVIVIGDNKGSPAAPEAETTSYMVAVHRVTGDVVWRVNRPLSASYGSPIIAKMAGRDQLLISGAQRIAAYDPATGDEIWFCRWSAFRSANSLALGPDCVVASTTWPETQMICVRADGAGDVTDTHVVWKHARTVNDIPSAIFHDGRLYSVTDRGMAICMDGKTGKPIWQNRLGGPVSASPILVGESILATDEDGNSFLFKTGAQFELQEKSFVADRVLASPALSGDYLYMRSAGHLWCIDGKSTLPVPVAVTPKTTALTPKTTMVAPVITPSTVKGGDSKQADSSDVPPILWLAIGGLFLLTILAAILLLVLLLKPVEAAPEPAATTKAANTRKDAPQYAVFPCTACGRKLKIKAAPVGKKVKCPHCTAIVTVVASP